MTIIVSAIIIFILLCASAGLAFVVPLDPEWPRGWPRRKEAQTNCETDSVLAILAQHTKNVPAVL